MAADSQGNNLEAVGVAVTGRAALAPFGTEIPTPEQGKARALELNSAFKSLGLRAKDGAPEWAYEASGDPIEFFEDGYSLPTGEADVTVTMTLAETNTQVRELIAGKTPDEHGYITVDGGGHATRYVLYTETIFKNGSLERRIAPHATVKSIKQNKPQRGEPVTYETVFKIARHPGVENNHFGWWHLTKEQLTG